MFFHEGFSAIAAETGLSLDMVYFVSSFGLIFWAEILGFTFASILKFLTWSGKQFLKWFRAHNKKDR